MESLLLTSHDGAVRYCVAQEKGLKGLTLRFVPVGMTMIEEPLRFRSPEHAWSAWKRYASGHPDETLRKYPIVIQN